MHVNYHRDSTQRKDISDIKQLKRCITHRPHNHSLKRLLKNVHQLEERHGMHKAMSTDTDFSK